MRNSMIGSFMGILLGALVLMACGGGGGNGGGANLVIGESVLAAAQINGGSGTPVVTRFSNSVGASVTVTRIGTGSYEVDFGTDVSDRFWVVSIGSGNAVCQDKGITVTHLSGSSNSAVGVQTINQSGQASDLINFHILLY